MNKYEVIVLAQGIATCSGYTGTVLPQLFSCMSTCMQKNHNFIHVLMYLRHLSIMSTSSVLFNIFNIILYLSALFQRPFLAFTI